MSRERARRIIELLYLYAWGPQGNGDLRSECIRHIKFFKREYKIGIFKYTGNGGFEWNENIR